MNEFKKQYYIVNTPWERKWEPDNIPKFALLSNDKVVFHYDMLYSLFKMNGVVCNSSDKTALIVVSAINTCLRFYEKIKQLYPYNEVFVVLRMDNIAKPYLEVANTFVGFLPHFAVLSKENKHTLMEINKTNYFHIVYGGTSNYVEPYLSFSGGLQQWSLNVGCVHVKEACFKI